MIDSFNSPLQPAGDACYWRWQYFAMLVAVFAAIGCEQTSRPRDTAADAAARATTKQPAGGQGSERAADTGRPQPHAGQPPAGRRTADTHDPSNSPPPSRRNPVGHAIAAGGLREVDGGQQLQLAILDPADNESPVRRDGEDAKDSAEAAPPRHDWLPRPLRLDVRWGRQRPVVQLRQGRFFTIVGAILVQPAVGLARPTTTASAPRMPDLSQNLRPEWPGLCAAAATADILYRIGHRDPAMIGDHPFGPSVAANQAAGRLIAGLSPAAPRQMDAPAEITPGSLAGRMGNQHGEGATALGIVNGLRSWIEDHGGDTWRADLAFLDDEANGRSPAEQLNWFGRLGAAINSGGCLLLLWEGADWADRPAGEQDDRSQDADPRFAPLPAQLAEAHHQTAPGAAASADAPRSDATDSQNSNLPQSAAVQALARDLQRAREALEGGRQKAARQLAVEILEQALKVRFEEPGMEAVIEAARSIAAEADGAAAEKSRARDGLRTRYDG